MNKYDIVRKIENFAPLETQESWDCSGWSVELPEPNITKVMFALTVTDDVVNQALNSGCDMIISHHPLFYVPLWYKQVNIYSAHTNLDMAEGGTTDILIEKLGFACPEITSPQPSPSREGVRQACSSKTNPLHLPPPTPALSVQRGSEENGKSREGEAPQPLPPHNQPFCHAEQQDCHAELVSASYPCGEENQAESLCVPNGMPPELAGKTLKQVQGDTFGVQGDTEGVLDDTVGVLGDTEGVQGDTVGVQSDVVVGQGDVVGGGENEEHSPLRIVELEQPMTVEDLREKLLKISPHLRYVNNCGAKTVRSIGFCAGSGSEFIERARADAFVTGDVKFHVALEAKTVVFDIGHFESEIFAPELLRKITGIEGVLANEKSPFI